MDRRTDYKTALLIDAAIHAERASPARELASMGVPFEIAKRVLTKPAERRHPLPTAAALAAELSTTSRGADFLE